MSSESWTEPHHHTHPPAGGWREDTQQTMDVQGHSGMEEEEDENIAEKEAQKKKDKNHGIPVRLSLFEKDRGKHPEEPRGAGPFFFFGGSNGASIVVPYCESHGWKRSYDKTRTDYKLKWCETKSPLSYYSFKAGYQLLYQIPNNKVLTSKIGLLNSLREYDRVSSKVNYGQGKQRLMHEEFLPVTFRMDLKEERETFFNETCHDESKMWICKPTGLNQGRGIFLLHTLEDITAFRERLEKTIEQHSNRKLAFREPHAQIVQRYIQSPLLLKGRKFDVRSYFVIACTSPYMVFFRHGYVRLTCNLYDPNSKNLTAHLTNQFMQKKNPLYSLLKEETVWSMERFNEYINECFMMPKGLPKDWVLGRFTKRMQQIIVHCFQAVKGKLDCKLGFFDLIGCDFLIDEDFKVWLLEMNCNPALHTNCEVLRDVIPQTVTETLDLSLEIFKKASSGVKLLPLNSQKNFQLLYSGETMAITNQRNKRLPYSSISPKVKSIHKTVPITQTGKSTNTSNKSSPARCPVPSTSVLSSSNMFNPSQHSQQAGQFPIKQPSKAAQRPPQVSKITQPHQTRTTHARTELHYNSCNWQKVVVSTLTLPQQPLRSDIMSLSTPAMGNASVCPQRRAARDRHSEKKGTSVAGAED